MTQAPRNCLVCRSNRVELFLDLGSTTLANKFLARDELGGKEPAYPLRVGFCQDCGHVQLLDAVPPTAMFDDYLYISSASDTLKGHLTGLADTVVERRKLPKGSFVVDIGSNDGTLLSGYKRHGMKMLGVDPAANLAERARAIGVETLTAYFGPETARKVRETHGVAAAITATNVFPHLPDLPGLVKGLDVLLAEDGLFVLEAHYLQDLLDAVAFDTVYHEHCSYWALGPMTRLFGDHGFEIVDVERLPIHHGQLRAWVGRRGRHKVNPRVEALLADERAKGIDKIETYRAFAQRALALKTELNRVVDKLLAERKTIAAYGAPAKGNTLLTFLGLGPDRISYIADRSPLKQGRYTPGTHIPVVPPERLLADQPDYALLLAWNFADEIMAQQAEYRRRGGRFIVPVPEVRVL